MARWLRSAAVRNAAAGVFKHPAGPPPTRAGPSWRGRADCIKKSSGPARETDCGLGLTLHWGRSAMLIGQAHRAAKLLLLAGAFVLAASLAGAQQTQAPAPAPAPAPSPAPA